MRPSWDQPYSYPPLSGATSACLLSRTHLQQLKTPSSFFVLFLTRRFAFPSFLFFPLFRVQLLNRLGFPFRRPVSSLAQIIRGHLALLTSSLRQ
jgi:hypothetical protein